MFHPHTRVQTINHQVGLGLVASARIPRGTIVWVADTLDIRVPVAAFARLHPEQQATLRAYGYRDELGNWFQSWDNGRFVNHSCAPNTLCSAHNFSLAIRDIEIGDEITEDWAWNNMELDVPCGCGAHVCRGKVSRGDADALAAWWLATMEAVYPRITTVEQPLWGLLSAAEVHDASHNTPTATFRPILGDPR